MFTPEAYVKEYGTPATSTMQYDRHPPADSIGTDSPSNRGGYSDDNSAVSHAALLAANAALRSELAAVELERSKLAETQRRVVELLGCASAELLVHDVRNLLNERALLKALADISD